LSESRGLPASGVDAPDLRRQGRSRSKLLQALDNKEDGVSSAFPQGKQNEDLIQKFITHVYTNYNMLT